MNKRVMTAVVVMATLAPAILSAKALQPLLVTGPDCLPGSGRSAPWLLFEDLNGDGAYDFITAGDCNGDVRGRHWNPSVQSDPWSPTGTDIIIGSLPAGSVGLVPTLTFNEGASGLYAWKIVEHATTASPEVCHLWRDESMALGMTCPPRDDENLY